MTVQRKQYSAEFKQEAVRLITEGGRSLAQVARELGINGKMLGKWKRQLTLAQQAQAQGRTSYEAFPGQGRAHDEELAQLRRENAALRMERDVLKKAIAIFAEPRPR
jgi:transposase